MGKLLVFFFLRFVSSSFLLVQQTKQASKQASKLTYLEDNLRKQIFEERKKGYAWPMG